MLRYNTTSIVLAADSAASYITERQREKERKGERERERKEERERGKGQTWTLLKLF